MQPLTKPRLRGGPMKKLSSLRRGLRAPGYEEAVAAEQLDKAIQDGREAEQELARAKLTNNEAAAMRIVDERVRPAANNLLAAVAELKSAVSADWRRLHGLLPDNLA